MIVIENLFFRYPDADFKLKIDDLKFNSGSKTAIIGTSGFGKTTMLNLLAGIILPQQGTVKINEEQINNLSDKNRRNYRIENIGFVFQDFRLIPYLNVSDNIRLPFRINSSLKMENDTLTELQRLAADLGISNKLHKYPFKLSQGEKQRVAICRALINKPKIILADEPTGNLDPDNKKRIMDILFNAVEKNNSTLITVTHDHDVLEGFEQVIDFKNFQAR
ncbi:ABC transporter ATP-binding protein [Lutimonas sp.]|uniref:ABC transporter ATP-binding protein n=1 Tax=Lutimonas sp. TaxID=1872403 RepID=UPI003D9B58E7